MAGLDFHPVWHDWALLVNAAENEANRPAELKTLDSAMDVA